MTTAPSTIAGFAPLDLSTGREMKLAMQTLWLTGRILPAGARLIIRHTFRSQEESPIEAVYGFALPRDAALRRFEVQGEGFSVHSELKPVEEALAQYERGIEAGHLSTLMRQYGDGLVNLTLGNIRPGEMVTVAVELLAGVESRDDGFRFRFPFTLAPSYHPHMRAARLHEGVGELELPAEQFGDLILPKFAQDAGALHRIGFDLDIEVPAPVEEIDSPSHRVRVGHVSNGSSRVSLATAEDVPNRDLVLDVRVRDQLSGVLAGRDSDGKVRFSALLPSTFFGTASKAHARVAIVVDRSGSMQGAPVEQAKKAIEACLAALSPDDQFTLIAFDNQIEVFRPALVPGTTDYREEARKFLQGIDARGGTELAPGLLEAARILERDGGDILVMTDGQVFTTEDILAQVRTRGIRVHTLGIGSASQDRFLALLARETGGVSRFLTPRERVDLAAVELFSSIGKPVATGLKVSGALVEPEPPGTVFAGTPAVVWGEANGAPELVVSWDGGSKRLALPPPAADVTLGDTLRLLQGARLLTDLDSRLAGPAEAGVAGRRERERLERLLETLSQCFLLASRRMALVAVVERVGDRPGVVPKTRIVPVGMPEDVEFGAYFGTQRAQRRASAMSFASMLMTTGQSVPSGRLDQAEAAQMPQPRAERDAPRTVASAFRRAAFDRTAEREEVDLLLELVCRLEPDGGMSGRDDEERLIHSLVVLLVLLAEGHSTASGTFRAHVTRLVSYLQTANWGLHAALAAKVLDAATRGRALSGDWWSHARKVKTGQAVRTHAFWKEIEQAV